MKAAQNVYAYLRGIFFSLPVQLLFLHFRKYQVLLIFWVLMFLLVNSSFMKSFGADSLFLAPEYMGSVNSIGFAIMGMSIAVFIMCWNITTFILFSRHFSFLAATAYPFLKYCINNAVMPLAFLIFYCVRSAEFLHEKELLDTVPILFLAGGFFAGLLLILAISFFYFFRADKTIFKKLQPAFKSARKVVFQLQPEQQQSISGRSLMNAEWFLDSFFKVRRCRDVSHYSENLMERVFKQHHFAAVVSLIIAYIFLIIIGYFLDHKFFQLPAGASITLFCAILIGVCGALVYFFQSWTVPAFLCFLALMNLMYKSKFIDPTNKAFGLSYNNTDNYPEYTQKSLAAMSVPDSCEADKRNMEGILDKWKAKQGEEKPLLILITTSGGGSRSATFTMDVLQRLDSLTNHQIMRNTFLITGASGGMIGASYFRELYRRSLTDSTINLQTPGFADDIATDLLNPTFTSFIARDLFAPEQRVKIGDNTYLRDRGYAFELALNDNTNGLLNRKLGDYADDEREARIPMMLYHTVVTRDAKMMLIGTQPMRFMMAPPADSSQDRPLADAVDYSRFFSQQHPFDLRMLSILRMNATFPVVLPNVYMPTKPLIDVMDGGLRDNYGIENALRMMGHMKDWITANTRGVLVLQIRDRMDGGWENPFESENLTENAVKPFFLLQHNWYKMMEYFQGDMSHYFINNSGYPIHKISFQYIPSKEENKAALNFHLAKREKLDIHASINSKHNMEAFQQTLDLLQLPDSNVKKPVTAGF